jgi:hypothetical protein
MNEEWKQISDWPEYEISSFGNVRRNGKPIRSFVVKGYLAFNVCGCSARKSLRVHREVAKAFLFNPGCNLVRHLNGNPLDNRVDNLAWGTSAENEADKRLHGTAMSGESHHQSKLTAEQVNEIRRSSEKGVVLAERFGVAPRTISAIRNGLIWKGLVCN